MSDDRGACIQRLDFRTDFLWPIVFFLAAMVVVRLQSGMPQGIAGWTITTAGSLVLLFVVLQSLPGGNCVWIRERGIDYRCAFLSLSFFRWDQIQEVRITEANEEWNNSILLMMGFRKPKKVERVELRFDPAARLTRRLVLSQLKGSGLPLLTVFENHKAAVVTASEDASCQ